MASKKWISNRLNSVLIDEEFEEGIKITDYNDVIKRLDNFYGQGEFIF